MKKIIVIGLLIIGYIAPGCSSESLTDIVKFASIEEANKLLTQEDDYTNSWSQFDIDSRIQQPNSTKEELFDFISQQTIAWTAEEKNEVLAIFKSIDAEISKQAYAINFPKDIYFIKTTLEEEGGADAYTRANYVVLKDELLTQPKDQLKMVIIHELFHILSRNNPEFRKELYQLIGFNLMNNVEYPDNLKAYRITNPDAPQTDNYITLTVDGEPKACMMILYSSREYTSGSFFDYLNVGFLSLVGDSIKTIEYKDDEPVIYSFQQVTGFFEQVGKNTQYIIHPEEILADNFAFVLLNKTDLPNPELVEKIKKVLQK